MTSIQWLPPSVRAPTQQGRSYSSSIQSLASTRDTYDLCTSDGPVTSFSRTDRHQSSVSVEIHHISPAFRGFAEGNTHVEFVLKSSLSQLGIAYRNAKINIQRDTLSATVTCDLVAISPLAVLALDYITEGCKIGKLFSYEERRLVRTMEYVERMLEQVDMKGEPLLVYGNPDGSNPEWELKTINKRVIAWLPVMPGTFTYGGEVHGFLPTIGAALKSGENFKDLLRLHQQFQEGHTRIPTPNSVLMVRTYPMHLKTMFGRVVTELLPQGICCTGSNVIEPTKEGKSNFTGRTFVLHGDGTEEVSRIPVEFYSLESYREHVPFEIRNTLARRCADVRSVLKVFATMPREAATAATFLCKGSMFDRIRPEDWIVSAPQKKPYVGQEDPVLQQKLAQEYLFQQCEYGILSAISVGDITSDGVLFTRCFPSPVLKSLLLSRQVVKRVRALYFVMPSRNYGAFFSHEDAAMLRDLNTFGISIFYVDESASTMYQFMLKVGQSSGMFVPLERRLEYLNATFLGVYGSNLVAGDFEAELHHLLSQLLHFRKTCKHPLMNPDKPLALVTGGGPGAMEVGNRVAKSLGILSCGMYVDFGSLSNKPGATINEQKKNPYVEAFMTYRPDKLVERQSDFNLDFPIFLTGGIGTDFEYALEEVRRKVGSVAIHPMVLFGTAEHWGRKITGRFQENLHSGTIKGSEWISNVPWVVNSGKEALAVWTRFFEGILPIGPSHKSNERGFMVVDKEFMEGKW